MAKISLKDSVKEEEIIDLEEEINVPNILLEGSPESGYGITGGYGDYSLVEKKIAYRSVKEEDNVDKKYKVIKYATWVDCPSYNSTLLECVNSWINKRNLTKIKALKKANFSEVEKIYNYTRQVVKKAMESLSFSDNAKSSAVAIDNYNTILKETEDIKSIIKEANQLHELIKEKRKILIADTEPKKHRLKESEM